MDAERYAQVRVLFDAVIDLAPPERAAALAARGVPDAVAADVLALCAKDDDDRTGALTDVRDGAIEDALAPVPETGDVFGPWRVVAEIGRGGMGRVYRVERADGSYRQTAALKFIKGLAGAAAIQNFERERQLLASLAHPRIARLLDGGSDARGRPYLVMEYVEGRPIDAWCRDHALGRAAVVDLFVAACAAVSHAHRHLVVHCDLKPSNILVDAQGQPMLLDFGIARFAERSDADAAGEGTSGYTPGFASPEQRRGERVSVASDVYSLGIVLRDLFAAAGAAPGPELAAIVACATRDDPAQRYASVDALCEDLERWRTHRPVRALPATAAYRAARFLRRHAVALAIVAGIVLLSAAFTGKVVAESRRAQAAEQAALAERDRALRAEREARASEEAASGTSRFLISVFEGANPDAGSGNVSIAALLDQALTRVEKDLPDKPGTQAQMSAALAEVLFVIGQHERARALYAKAIALERTQQRPLVLAQMLLDNAAAYQKFVAGGDTPNDDVREALRLVAANASEDSPVRLEITRNAAGLLSDADPAEAKPYFEQGLALMRRLRPGSLDLAEMLATYGWSERARTDYDHAIALMQEANALRARLQGEAHEDYASGLMTTANTMSLARRFDEAGPLFERALALHRRYGRLDGKVGAWALAQYASFLVNAGRAKDALPLYDEIFAYAARKLAPDDGAVLVWRHNYTRAVAEAGDPQHAAAISREALAQARRLWGDDPRVGRVSTLLATILSYDDCDTEGGAAVDGSLAIYAAKRPPDEDDLYLAQIQRARWLVSCRRLDEAAATLADAAPPGVKLLPMTAWRRAVVQALLHLERNGDAAALAEVEATEAQAAALFAPGDPRIALAQWPRAQWLQAHGHALEASKLAAAMLAGVENRLVPHSPWLERLRALDPAH